MGNEVIKVKKQKKRIFFYLKIIGGEKKENRAEMPINRAIRAKLLFCSMIESDKRNDFYA